MKRFALCLMVLFGWIITYYHPKPGAETDIYKTQYKPEIMTRLGYPVNVWEVTLNDKTKLYLPAQSVTVQEVNEETPKEKKE